LIIFAIQNSRTSVRGASEGALHILNLALSYPTEIAALQERGITIPGTWDGWYHFLHIPRTTLPWFPTGLISRAGAALRRAGFEVGFEDQRERPRGGLPEMGVTIPLRDYQEEAVRRAVEFGRGVIDYPPRSGKTRAMVEIHRRLALPTIWIAPTDRIVVQTLGVIEGFFGPNYAMQLVGVSREKEASFARVVVTTAATAVNLSPEFYKTREMIVVDEWHHASAKSYSEIFSKCDHIYYRFGMTGTFFRSGHDDMAMQALLSESLAKVSSEELVRRGFLVPTHVVFIPVIASKLRGVGDRFNGGFGKAGIHEHEWRNHTVAEVARFLAQSGMRVLILVGTKRQGRLILSKLRPLFTKGSHCQFSPVEFISTDCERGIQVQILRSFNQGQEVQILIGTTIIGEGVDLPIADALVYARGEKAKVGLIQSSYRVGTAASGKSQAILVDFADRHHKILLSHSMQRLQVFYDEPTFSVTVLNDLSEFPRWLEERRRPGENRV